MTSFLLDNFDLTEVLERANVKTDYQFQSWITQSYLP